MNSPPSSSAAPAEKSLSSDGGRDWQFSGERISKPLTHIEVEAERIKNHVLRVAFNFNSIDGLEVLSSELRQLQIFLKSEVERVQSEIESALAGNKIIVETIAPWVRAVRAGAKILNPHNFVGDR